MSEEVSRRRLFGWLAAAAIAVTAPTLVASEPAEAQTVGMERKGITTARTAHGSENAAPRSSCLAGRRRAGRRGVM